MTCAPKSMMRCVRPASTCAGRKIVAETASSLDREREVLLVWDELEDAPRAPEAPAPVSLAEAPADAGVAEAN
jgi:hypothetical protein